MKTYRNLYSQVWSFENLYLAWRKARKGKRSRPQVARFERVQEAELRDFTYEPGPYHSFFIHDPKKRLISAAPFRDRVSGVSAFCFGWPNRYTDDTVSTDFHGFF
jgi:hypothetical protein